MQYTEIFALSAAFLCLQGDPEPDRTGGVPVPGGVVDVASQTAYLGDVGRGIVAIHASDGKLRWESRAATRPLALQGGRLTALKMGASSFSIAVLDAETGGLIRESAVLGVNSFAPNSWVRTRASVTGKTLRVRWLAMEMARGGARGSGIDSGGIVLMDIDTAELEIQSGAETDLPFPLEGILPVNELPEDVRDVARRERWLWGAVVGEQVYGEFLGASVTATERTQTYHVHVFDLATDEVVWRSTFETRVLMFLDRPQRP